MLDCNEGSEGDSMEMMVDRSETIGPLCCTPADVSGGSRHSSFGNTRNFGTWPTAQHHSLLCAHTLMAARNDYAKCILYNGKFKTSDRSFSAVAIGSDGNIQHTGNDEEVDLLKGPETKVIDLHGRVAIPGKWMINYSSTIVVLIVSLELIIRAKRFPSPYYSSRT